MRIIKSKLFDGEIRLEKETFYHLIIESPNMFRNFLTGIRKQLEENEEFLLSYENDAPVQLSKFMFLIDNPLKIELDEKKTNTLIQKDIASRITIGQKEEYESLLNSIIKYIEDISFDYDLPITVDYDFTLAGLLKSLSLSSFTEDSNFLEYLVNQIKKILYVLKLDTIVLVNIKDYLTKDEFNQLIHELRLREIFVILISGHQKDWIHIDEKIILIDNDLCELHIDGKLE